MIDIRDRAVSSPRHIAILGATGSIGRSAIDVVRHLGDGYRITYLTAHRNIDVLRRQIAEVRPRGVVVTDPADARALRRDLDGSTEVLSGDEGLREIVTRSDVDVVLSALVGFAGLAPTLTAVEAGKEIALANKETLVAGGALIMDRARARGVRILPVDSEHSAILQCLQGEDRKAISRLLLTASGGPFLHLDQSAFAGITPAQALNHPTWRMGRKITIDSATLMNKGLEVIEAHWLFDVEPEQIEVVVHPQSIIHSMVEFADGSIKAQLGIPDMRLPIQYALTAPARPPAPHARIDFALLKQMTFFSPDMEKFRSLALAFQALKTGGTAPAVLNAANEAAVELFLDERLSFAGIPALIEDALAAHTVVPVDSLETIVAVDAEARAFVREHAPSYSFTP